jgi:hypothetical protein
MGNNNLTELLKLVDWTLQARRPFVVLDPFDPTGILYLTDKDYQVLVRTCMKSGEALVVLARPGSKPPKASGTTGSTESGGALQS